MKIVIENSQLQKRTEIEVPDDFYTEADDMFVYMGFDRYKLVSTKSAEDKRREELAIQFGETFYGELYNKFPNFGSDDCLLTRDACKDIIKAQLVGQYEDLIKDEHPDAILNGLVTAFANYCQVRNHLAEQDKEIREGRKHENVFFDYILRFESICNNASTLCELSSGITKCHEYATIDERQIFGYAKIVKQLEPFFNWCSETDAELKCMSGYKPIHEQLWYKDPEYYDAHVRLIVNECANNLVALKYEYDKQITNQLTIGGNPFTVYTNKILELYKPLIANEDKLTAIMKNGEENADVAELESIKDTLHQGYKDLIEGMINILIDSQLDPRTWENDYYKQFIQVQWVFVDDWHKQLLRSKEAHSIGVRSMMLGIRKNYKVIQAILDNKLDVEKLMTGEYTEEKISGVTGV